MIYFQANDIWEKVKDVPENVIIIILYLINLLCKGEFLSYMHKIVYYWSDFATWWLRETAKKVIF